MAFMTPLKNMYILTKPGITRMNLVTVTIGFFLGGLGVFYPYKGYVALLLGTWCVASGAGMLNSYLERDLDSKMDRTKARPLPLGLVVPVNALIGGLFLCAFGLWVHYAHVNALTAMLSLATVLLYIMVYTPLKTITWLNTFIGSIPGALPIVGGWTAATNSLDVRAWMLFFVLFAWQHPHFFALAIMYKEDYKKANMMMLPVIEQDNVRTIRQILIYTILMILGSLLPVMIGLLGYVYAVGILCLGVMMLWFGWRLAQNNTVKDAKKLFLSSIVYLPLWLLLMVIDFYIK